ncbi:glycosyltransferase family 2 protein [Microbacterium sediminicola]|uniref:glycosyltransferase family 2 protein n=1 Tax=Microbacterium sediminicola TaxID=415210 RepID=UPI0031D3590F
MSVVIPTVGRAALAVAVESALAQSYPVAEVIVCVDSSAAVSQLLPDDSRIRTIRVGPGAGGNVARQAGIEAATSDLIALLDDDDMWSAEKISTQVGLAAERRVCGTEWLATSRLVARFRTAEEIWPRDLLKPGERIGEYVLRKHRPKGGQGFVQASTLLFPRELAIRIPFDPELRFHQDVDWLLSVDQQTPDLTVVQCEEALTTYNIGGASVSGGAGIDPAASVAWAVRRISEDKRSLGDFILTTSVIYAARRGSLTEVVETIARGVRYGRPGFSAFSYAGYRMLTTAMERTFRRRR